MRRKKRTNGTRVDHDSLTGFQAFAREEARLHPELIPTMKDYIRYLVDLDLEWQRLAYAEKRDRFYARLRDQYAKEKADPEGARDG